MNNNQQARNKSATKTNTPIHQYTNTPQPKAVVWTFTNKRELNKKEFIDYVERKVFRTIRKQNSLPDDKTIILKKAKDLNTKVLIHILQTKFQVKLIPTTDNRQPTTDSSNLSQIAEDIFKEILKGNFSLTPNTQHPTPLIYLSDKEIELYAKLKNIKGTKRKQDKKIQDLFSKFLKKNPDLELNIIKAASQLK
ncbi:MAG: hypothetical protein KJ592_04860 [Nanoarchaeota archaeon]|nr:hypothetical protein [Nanoarchaeota archaeon]